MQSSWASEINPIIARQQNQSIILKNISLASGTTTINHRLGRELQGWKIVRQRSAANIYDDQDHNEMPSLTLRLVSNANVIVDLEVF